MNTGIIIDSKVFLTNNFLLKCNIPSRTLNNWKGYTNPGNKREKLYNYQELKDKVKAILPPLIELKAKITAEEHINIQSEREALLSALPLKWMAFINNGDTLYFQSKVKIDGVRANNLTISMAILRFLHYCKGKTFIKEYTGLENREEIFKYVAEYLKKTDSYGLPQSYDRLREKYYEYVRALEANDKDERDILISVKFGNSNRLKCTDEHEAIILEFYLMASKLNMYKCWEDYKAVINKEIEKGRLLEPVSYSTLKRFCTSNYVTALAAKCRHGNSYYETHVRPFVLRKDPEFSFSLIAGDGWVPGRTVKQVVNGKIVAKTMTVWIWYDWKSRAILSYNIAPTETGEMIRNSFRDILNLHGDVCPLSVMVDKKWSQNKDTKSMFTKAGVFVQDKRAYNPKANIAERSNKELNKLHRILDEHWANVSIQVPSQNQNYIHNAENTRGVKPMEENEFREMILKIVNIHNNTAQKRLNGKTPMEVCQENVNPKAKPLDPLVRTWIFGEKKIRTVRNGMLTIEIASKKYEYIVPNWSAFLKQKIKGNKVKVYYDEKYMDRVDLFSFEDENDDSNDHFICSCDPAERMNVAHVEQINEDKINLGKQLKRGKAFDETIEADLKKQKAILESCNIDLASVHAVTQDQYKDALSSAIAQQYGSYMDNQDRDKGIRKHKPKQAAKSENEEEVRLKYEQYQSFIEEFNQ